MTIGKLLFVLLPMLFIGTALLTLLAASAKSLKEAQSHMSWLMLLPMVPSFVLMVNPIKTEGWQFAVPFLAPFVVWLVTGAAVWGWVTVALGLVWGAVALWLGVRLGARWYDRAQAETYQAVAAF